MPTLCRSGNIRRSARLNPSSINSSSLTPVRISAHSRSRREVFVELAPRPDLKRSLKRRKLQSKSSRSLSASSPRVRRPPPHPNLKLDNRDARLAVLEAALLQTEIQEKQSTLKFLEDQFTCSLCCEILAHPVSVTSQCGHVFCAICILMWIFSKIHDPCGFWHTTASCPNCRVSLCPTPYDLPRSNYTLPIVFNRTADTAIDSLFTKFTPTEKKPGSSYSKVPQQCSNDMDNATEIKKWLGDGAFEYWAKRRGDGKRELEQLIEGWRDMTTDTFREIKHRLQV